MLLYGASGHGKVIFDILSEMGIPVRCFLDDNRELRSFYGLPVFHSLQDADAATGEKLIISIGNNAIRKRLADCLPLSPITAIHPSARLSPTAAVGEGSVVMAHTTVNSDSVIGRHCIVNTNASIDHDCALGDFVHISPNAALAGNVTVGEGAHVGIGACVVQGVHIGKWATVGAGAVVIRHVPDYATVVGNPAKVISIKEQ